MSKYEFIKYLEEGEECKEIKGYPDYFITSYGRVWSNKQRGKWLSVYPQHKYYQGVNLYDGNHLIHSLVGRNFLPDYRKGLWILHKDETLPSYLINRLDNLYVGDIKQNMRDMDKRGRRNGLSPNDVIQIREMWENSDETINHFSTRVGKRYNKSRTGIRSIILRQSWDWV